MADERRVLHHVRRLFAAEARDGPGDAELLRRFARDGDEAAFELLVWRHAEMVLTACRRLLRDDHAAEDAFQATFLVLFRKAGAVRHGEALAGWLHRVAGRVALRAKGRVATTGQLDQLPAAATPGLDADLLEALHEEVSHLPAYYRAVVVCCFLEGRTHDEAARVLGWPRGTVAGRLARAKDLLHRRLTSRGFAPAVALAVGMGGASATLAARVGALMTGLRAVAAGEAVGLSPRAVLLAEGVMGMFGMKTKTAALALLGVALLGLGAAVGVGRENGRPADVQAARPAGEQPAAAAKGDPLDETSKRAQVRRHLRMLAGAMHGLSDATGRLPPAAITDKAGKPLLSWRVALLPYLGHEELYKQFRLNEAWDSPHNKKLLAKMPAVYTAVSPKAAKYATNYQLVVGPTALFTSHRREAAPPGGGSGDGAPGEGGPGGSGATAGQGGPGMGGPGPGMGRPSPGWHAVRDGLSITLLLVEAGRAVPWTRPEDVAYDPDRPVPPLGGAFPNTFHVAFADGEVAALPRRIEEKALRALITSAGGEVVDAKQLRGTSPAREAAMKRLRERNEKLSDEAAALRDVLRELREEVVGLRWAAEDERVGQLDPEMGQLQKQNAALEKAIKDGAEEARKLAAEVRRLRKALKKDED